MQGGHPARFLHKGACAIFDGTMKLPVFFYPACVALVLVLSGMSPSARALEKSSFYVGVDASHVWFREFEDDTPAYLLRAGFKPSRYYAFEIGQLAFFDMRNRFDNAGDLIDMRIKGGGIFSLSVLGIYPLGKRLSVQGRLGLSLWSVFYELESSAFPGVITNRKDDDQGVSVGIGLTYDLNPLVGVHGGLDYYYYQPSTPPYDEGREIAPTVSLGIVVRPFDYY